MHRRISMCFMFLAPACFMAMPLTAQSAPPICQHPENPAYFLWRGKAVALITSAEHYGAVINLDFDYIKYLDTLQRDGLNYTRIFTGSYVEPSGAFNILRNTLAPASGRFLAPFLRSDQPGYAGGGNKFDLERFNPEYFARLKVFLREAGSRGIVVEMTLFCSTYNENNWAIHPFNPANNIQTLEIPDYKLLHTTECPQAFPYQERYVRRMVAELGEFDNCFFEIQNEPWADNHVMGEVLHPYWTERPRWPNSVEIPHSTAVAWQAQIARVIRDAQSGRDYPHMIGQNIANFRLSVREDDYSPGVDLLNFHYAFPQAVTWNRGHGKIIGYDESGFAGREDATYRRQAWRFIMSGGGLFNNLDYSFTVGKEDGSDVDNKAPGGGSPTLRRQIGVLSRFLHTFDLAKLTPNDRLVSHCPGAACYALSEEGKAHALYLEGRGGITMTVRLEPGRWAVTWIDPASGATVSTGTFNHNGGEAKVQVPAFPEDALAVRLVKE